MRSVKVPTEPLQTRQIPSNLDPSSWSKSPQAYQKYSWSTHPIPSNSVIINASSDGRHSRGNQQVSLLVCVRAALGNAISQSLGPLSCLTFQLQSPHYSKTYHPETSMESWEQRLAVKLGWNGRVAYAVRGLLFLISKNCVPVWLYL